MDLDKADQLVSLPSEPVRGDLALPADGQQAATQPTAAETDLDVVQATSASQGVDKDAGALPASGPHVLKAVAAGDTLEEWVQRIKGDRLASQPEAVWTIAMLQAICSEVMTAGPARRSAQLNVYRSWTLGPLEAICGIETAVWQASVADGETRLPVDPQGPLFFRADADFRAGRYRDALIGGLDALQKASDYFEVGFALNNMLNLQDLAFEQTNDPRLILIDPGPLEDAELLRVMSFAHELRFCQLHGGCDARHPLLLRMCFRTGCDSGVSAIERVIEDLASPREQAVLDQVMRLFAIDVERLASQTAN